MLNLELLSSWNVFKQGSLWKSYVKSNARESAAVDHYVEEIGNGHDPKEPMTTTATGRGLIGVIAAMKARRAVISHLDLQLPEAGV